MLNSTVLDVAIGLVFIYLLYSLLATTIKELLATIFSYRGRMLERGIEQMLDGTNYKYTSFNKLYVFFKMVRNKDVPDDTVDENGQPVKKKTTIHQKALAHCSSKDGTILKNSVLCKKSKLFAAKVTGHPLYIRSSEQSWLSKKPAYLASDTFSDILIDLFTPAGNSNVLLKNIKDEVDKLPDNDLKKILNIYITQANGDLQRFKLLVEKWYDDTMYRVSGWYKKQAFKILLIIGLILAIVFNVSTIEIVQKLSTDKPVRDAMIKSASEYVKEHKTDFDSNTPAASPTGAGGNNSNAQATPVKDQPTVVPKPDTAKAKKDTLIAAGKKAGDKAKNTTHQIKTLAKSDDKVKDTLNKTAQTANNAKFDNVKAGVKKISDLYSGTIQQENTTLGLGWGNYGFTADSIQWVKDSAYVVKKDPELSKDPKCLNATLLRPEHKGPFGRFFYVLWQTIKTPRKWIGFLLTALAISLGAPFWFDLLNKFINMRASGTKPDDNDDKSASKTATLNQKPDPSAKG